MIYALVGLPVAAFIYLILHFRFKWHREGERRRALHAVQNQWIEGDITYEQMASKTQNQRHNSGTNSKTKRAD